MTRYKQYVSVLLSLTVVVLLLPRTVSPADESLTRTGGLRKIMGPEHVKSNIHDGNRILTIFFNYGAIGYTLGSLARTQTGVYPKGSGHSYYADFAPFVGSEVVDAKGNTIHIFSDGKHGTGTDEAPDGHLWRFEPLPGYDNPDLDRVAMNDDPESWPPTWPDRDPSWDGFWNGEYGKYARSDQESYFRMNDYYNDEFEFYPDPTDSSMRGLGLEVAARGYQWAHVAAEDILMFTYRIMNKSKTKYDKIVFGMYGDPDVGDDGDQNDDDSSFDIDDDIVFVWDHDNRGAWDGPTATFGWKFLESPGNPYDGIDNDGDGMIDESQYDNIDNDGDWNAETDDVGADGLGPVDQGYPGVDEGEGDGLPTVGEPNFEHTDNDEADQIGLTSFTAFTFGTVLMNEDETMWEHTLPGFFDRIEQTVDITFMYGSGYFPLEPGDTKKFAVALVFGEDLDDLVRNARTMQRIYDADYSFAQPPNKPKLTVVPGDHKVTLYWDDSAESSRDPIYGYDFEGYTIYRSTDPAFLESWVVTDAYGNKVFNKPIAQFDKNNGLKGPHPVGISGAQFNMGEDTGLSYIYVDTTVENGQSYYYAVCSYDQGYSDEFFEMGISEYENLQPMAPSECTKVIEIDMAGRVTALDDNTAMVVPDAPAAGYSPPLEFSTYNPDAYPLTRTSGFGTGKVDVKVIDPRQVQEQWTYVISFTDADPTSTEDKRKSFSVLNSQEISETFLADTSWVGLDGRNLAASSVTVTDTSGSLVFVEEEDYALNYALGIIRLVMGSNMEMGRTYRIAYRYYPIYKSTYLGGEELNPLVDGLSFVVSEDELGLDVEGSGWIAGDCNYEHTMRLYAGAAHYAADFEFRFEGYIGDNVREGDFLPGTNVPFVIWNVVEERESRFVLLDQDGNKYWNPGESVAILKDTVGMTSCYEVILTVPDSIIVESTLADIQTTYIDTTIGGIDTTIAVIDTTWSYDTTFVEINHPEPGDVFLLHTFKPFTAIDRFQFTTTAAKTVIPENESLRNELLDRIAVVPNPYVVTASWESEHYFTSGRGERKIDFIHLPEKCVIRIFTMSGNLVDTIEHDSPIDDGSESWNLVSKDGMDIAFGIYIYHIEAPGVGEKIGKFAVIK